MCMYVVDLSLLLTSDMMTLALGAQSDAQIFFFTLSLT